MFEGLGFCSRPTSAAQETAAGLMRKSDSTKPRPESALKYTFDPSDDRWHAEPCRVVLEQTPFAEGGNRVCHRLYQLGNGGDSVTCVAKMFKRKVSSKAYFDEALTQVVAECFAQAFNRQEKYRIAFVPAAVMALKDRNDQLLGVEPLMKGEYKKHNDNDGHVETNEFLPQAFSHFSWEASGHSLVVVDIQGVSHCYTDPQIHTIEGRSFGVGNMGSAGILKFLKSHRCNRVCQDLRLPIITRSVAVTQVERAKDLWRERMDQSRAKGRTPGEEVDRKGRSATRPASSSPVRSPRTVSAARVDQGSVSPGPRNAKISSSHSSSPPRRPLPAPMQTRAARASNKWSSEDADALRAEAKAAAAAAKAKLVQELRAKLAVLQDRLHKLTSGGPRQARHRLNTC